MRGIKIFGIAVIVIAVITELFLFSRANRVPYPDISFDAVYEWAPPGENKRQLCVYANGAGQMYADGYNSLRGDAKLEDYQAGKSYELKHQSKTYWDAKSFDGKGFLLAEEFYEPAFKEYLKGRDPNLSYIAMPLVDQVIAGRKCHGWRLVATGMEAGNHTKPIESWFDEPTGVLVRSETMNLKRLEARKVPPEIFKLPADYEEGSSPVSQK